MSPFVNDCDDEGLLWSTCMLFSTDEPLTTFAVKKKYKLVTQKVWPILSTLPSHFHIEQNIIGDPLSDLPALPTHLPPFTPCGHYTEEQCIKMDNLVACQVGSNAPLCFITERRLCLGRFWTWAFPRRFLPPCWDPCCRPYTMGQMKYPYPTRDLWWGLPDNLCEDGCWSIRMLLLIIPVALVLCHKEGQDKPPPSPQPRTT